MANIFISHRSENAAATERLARDLRRAGHEVVFQPWHKNLGDQLVAHVNTGLTGNSYLLLSYGAHDPEPWVNHSWQAALMRQLEYHEIHFIPLLLAGEPAPELLTELRYIDLTQDWDAALKELLWKIR